MGTILERIKDEALVKSAIVLNEYHDENYKSEYPISPVDADYHNGIFSILMNRNHDNYIANHVKFCIWTINDNMARIYEHLYRKKDYSVDIKSLFEEVEKIKVILHRIIIQETELIDGYNSILKDDSRYLTPYEKSSEEKIVMQAYNISPDAQIDLKAFTIKESTGYPKY